MKTFLKWIVENTICENLDHFAQISDAALDSAYGYGRSQPGSFGYEANKGSAKHALSLIQSGITDIEQISAAIHEGWAEVAKSFDDPVYQQKPEKKENRLKLAQTPYQSLSEEEKEKDRVVARAILAAFQQQQQQ
jgi:hypothetical protein